LLGMTDCNGGGGGAACCEAKNKHIAELACHSTSYSNVVSSIADYVATRVLDKDWVAQHGDLAFYVKAPLLLFEANRKQDAQAALHVAAQHVDKGFANNCGKVYGQDYPHCAWLWVCWAATRMSDEDLANRCFKKICSYQHRLTHTGLIRKPYRNAFDFEADFFATAVCAKAALLRNDVARAEGAGDALTRAIDANRTNMSKRQRFNLRWRWHDGLGEEHCVLQASDGQLLSMLGFPALVLLELSQTKLAKASAYEIAAADLLHFIKGTRDLQNNPEAHVVAAAAAAANDSSLATQVADNVASKLRASSSRILSDALSWEDIDHAAEAAVWLCHVNHSHASCVSIGKKKNKKKVKTAHTTQLPEDEVSLVAARKRKKTTAATDLEELEDEEELEETRELNNTNGKMLREHTVFGEGQAQMLQKESKQLPMVEKLQEEKKQKDEQGKWKRKRSVAWNCAEELVKRNLRREELSRADRKLLKKRMRSGDGRAPSKPPKKRMRSGEGRAPRMPKEANETQKLEQKQEKKQQRRQSKTKKRNVAAKGAEEPKQRKEPSMADRKTLKKHKRLVEGQEPWMSNGAKQLGKPEKKQEAEKKRRRKVTATETKRRRIVAAKGANEPEKTKKLSTADRKIK